MKACFKFDTDYKDINIMQRIDKQRQISIADDERIKIIREFESIFIIADTETCSGMYSLNLMEKKYPKLVELYHLVCI